MKHGDAQALFPRTTPHTQPVEATPPPFHTHTPEDIHLTAINDDLVGFFNSVPQQRLVDAVISLCNRWHLQHTTTTLTIEIQSTGNPIQHSHIGRHYIHRPKHIPLIVQQALQPCIFQACHTNYQQIQGAGIGSQLSPALCNVAITLIEHSWHEAHHTFLQQPNLHLFNTRYVDNRYILINDHFRQSLPITTLAHPDFYGNPVQIETVEDDHLSGFLINPQTRTPGHTISRKLPPALISLTIQAPHTSTILIPTTHGRTYFTSIGTAILYVTKGHSKEHCAAALLPSGKRSLY